MKHILVIVAILLNLSSVNAQEINFALHNETPLDAAPAKLAVSQIENDLVFRVTVENPGSDKVTLCIKDANNAILHQEVLPLTIVYRAKFNLQGLEDGNYTFEIRRGKARLAEKTIDIRTQTSINRTVSVQ